MVNHPHPLKAPQKVVQMVKSPNLYSLEEMFTNLNQKGKKQMILTVKRSIKNMEEDLLSHMMMRHHGKVKNKLMMTQFMLMIIKEDYELIQMKN